MSAATLRRRLREVRSELLPAGGFVPELWTRREADGDLWKGFCAIEGRTLALTGPELESRWRRLQTMNCLFSPMLFECTDSDVVNDPPKPIIPYKLYLNIDPERV